MTLALVDPIVGEVASLPSGAGSTLTDAGLGYDVAIGGLGFKLKVGDDSPYERATAQFKKDQLDSSQSYGDQSLLGYWTVGQFSFHKGAGINYYEPTDDTVVNRYADGEGVNPFSPGSVTLLPEWMQTTETATFTDLKWLGTGKDFLAVLDSVTLKYATSLTGLVSSYAPTAGSVVAATTGPLCAYVSTNASKIERVGIGAGAPASGALYTHTSGFDFIAYAKDRLWAFCSTDRAWYQFTPNPTAPPVAVVAGDKVFTVPSDQYPEWFVADTPGPVLFANGPRVYSVTISDAGAVPAMSGPVQVAELPTGESIYGFAYHLGFLGINTSKGFRIGVVSETGQVTYGPLLHEWGASGFGGHGTPAKRGSSLFFAGSPGTANAEIYEVNLAQQIGDSLEFAFTRTADRYAVAYGAFGVATWAGQTLISYDSTTLQHEGGNLAAAGTLTTGKLRFGTLEPKQFQTVRVRFGGTGGTITVYRVMADGSEISLYTIDVLQSTADEISLGLSSPLELLGLKFVLSRGDVDPSKGPALLGYQLRALPAPKRQRLIRLPLMLMDVERRGPARASGYEGSAWDRLSALEDMEQSGGVFQFQDFRTGEAGTVFIESIEHQGKTPPGKQSDGFGGVVFLTVRKL